MRVSAGGDRSERVSTVWSEMSIRPGRKHHEQSLELPVEELLRRGRPIPPSDESVIEDLTDEEAEAFFEAIRR